MLNRRGKLLYYTNNQTRRYVRLIQPDYSTLAEHLHNLEFVNAFDLVNDNHFESRLC